MPEQNGAPSPAPPSWRGMSLHDPSSSPSSLTDLRTEKEVLGTLLLQPGLIQEYGDLAISDFGGSFHQSLFRTMLKLASEGKDFDTFTVAEAWGAGAEKQTGDAAAYLADLFNGPYLRVPNLRQLIDKLHDRAASRRVRSLGENLQRLAENAQNDPYALMERTEKAIEDLRSGRDLNGEMLPYGPRNLSRRPDLLNLGCVEAAPIPWLWRPYLAYGMIHLLSGEPGCGKTWLALAFAAALTVGKVPFSGEACRPHDVVYLSVENSPQYVVRPRFDILEGDANRLHVLQGAVTGEGPKARREGVRLSDIPLLESALKQTGAQFLVVDPIQSYLGHDVDMHRSNETRPILDSLTKLAEKYNACFLILRHFAKSAAGSPINRGLGSIDVTAAARTELHAGKCDDQSVMALAKTNIGELAKSIGYETNAGAFRWTGETSITANDLGASGGMSEEDRDAASEASQCLADMLRGGPKLSSEVLSEMKELGVSERSVRRAKLKLGVKTRKRAGQRYGLWEWYLEDYEFGEIATS